ncbi:MAG TPA: metalloregulator ArsR/SmtB family transcription factor [Anaeromyxobacteraceae bacterium]|nr:metalloregulator ArsR/SmtB family transcription factor [Anaeromyxobacteraceae bacterium]
MEGLITAARGVAGFLGVLGSLADPTRLRLLGLLERHELGVVELCEALRLPQSTVSRHLKVLSEEGWLTARSQGTAHLYRMDGSLSASARRLWRVTRRETRGWSLYEKDAARLSRRQRERQREAEAFFAGAAAEWERMRTELYGAELGGEVLLGLLPRGLVVADLGCGTGDLAARLARHAARVLAVDRSAAMLRAARKRVAGLSNVSLHRADLEALPFDDASCDAALLVLALSYLVEPERALFEAARVLKPGGVLVLADLARHDDEAFRHRMGQANLGLDPDVLAALLAEAGFGAVRWAPLPLPRGARGPALVVARAEREKTPS